MIVLILLAFVGMLTGIFLILGMTPFTFAEELTKPLSGRQQPISKRIQQVNHPKEPKGIRKTVLEAREMLILTGKGGKFAAICAFSLFLAAMGAVICIVIQNYFMLPVLAAGMGLLPFWYVLFTSHSYKKLMNNEIETGLSIRLRCLRHLSEQCAFTPGRAGTQKHSLGRALKPRKKKL